VCVCVCVCVFNFNSLKRSFLLHYKIPTLLSIIISKGVPKRHNYLSKKTLVTFGAVLLSITTSSAYLENASVATNMYFFQY
jgi:hypothetical protein